MSNYAVPVTVRLDDAERQIVERIQAEHSRPGSAVSQSDAIRMALHDWQAGHPKEDGSEADRPFHLGSTSSQGG